MRVRFTQKEHRDAGMALLLLLLLIRILKVSTFPDTILVGIVLIIILLPSWLYPFSFLWYNLSDILGHVVSFVFLNIVYWVLVMPITLMRKMAGKDSLHLRQFKKNKLSVFQERNYTFMAKDFTNTF